MQATAEYLRESLLTAMAQVPLIYLCPLNCQILFFLILRFRYQRSCTKIPGKRIDVGCCEAIRTILEHITAVRLFTHYIPILYLKQETRISQPFYVHSSNLSVCQTLNKVIQPNIIFVSVCTMPMVPVQTARNKWELQVLDWIGYASRYRMQPSLTTSFRWPP